MRSENLLREIPVISSEGNPKMIGIHPKDIRLIEQTDNKKECCIVVEIGDRTFMYRCTKSFRYMMNFVNLSRYGLFLEN